MFYFEGFQPSWKFVLLFMGHYTGQNKHTFKASYLIPTVYCKGDWKGHFDPLH